MNVTNKTVTAIIFLLSCCSSVFAYSGGGRMQADPYLTGTAPKKTKKNP